MADDPSWTPRQDMSLLCRVCANQHDYLIPIFEGEGLDHDMPNKMDKHLPIKVRENDKLPTQMCYQCASTIIAWSELVTNCLEADKKLSRMLKVNENKADTSAIADEDAGSDHYEDAYDDVGGGGDDDNDDEDFEKEIKQLISDAGVKIVVPKAAKAKTTRASTRKRKSEAVPVKKENKKSKPDTSVSKSSTALIKPKEEVTSGEDRCIEVWSCCTCERFFSSQSGLRNHILSHAEYQSSKNKSDGICSACNVHLSNHCMEDKPKRGFTCYYCDEYFTEKSTLHLHMKIVHAATYIRPIPIWYTCRSCPHKLFRKSQGIVRHMSLWHDKLNIEPDQYVVKTLLDITYECKICRKRCYLSNTCSNHRPITKGVKANNNNTISNECEEHVDLHVCSRCHSKHNDCQALWSHIFLEHKNVLVRCNLCKRRYVAAKNNGTVLTRHMLQAHKKSIILETSSPKQIEKQFWKEFKNKCRVKIKGNEVFKCPYCPKVVQTFGSLQSHLNIHTKDRKYVCEVCGAWYLHNSSLLAHKATHSDMKFKCEFCGKTYAHRNHLRRHIDQVHVNKWKSLCKICNKVYQDVRTHSAVHSNDRPFVCTVCGSSYKWKKHLTRHEKICKISNTS